MKTGILQKFHVKRKFFAVFMILVCVIATMQDCIAVNAAVTAETPVRKEIPEIVNSSTNALWADGSSYSKDNSLDAIKWHYESKDGKYYFYLPSSAKLDELTIWHSFSNDLYVNDIKIENGETTDIFAGGGNFIVKSGSATYSLVVMKSENINTMFITTESGNLDAVNASKSNTDSGEMVYVDKKGKAEQVGLEQIKGRGNSSWKAAQQLFYKYPYNIKLDSKVKLFGMEKSKKWCLLANDFDQSLLRNKFVFDLAEDAGLAYTPEREYADVYQNGRYIGNYLVTSKVEIDSKRVDIYDLEGETEDINSEDLEDYSRGGSVTSASAGTYKYYNIPNNPEDISGGYLLEFELDERYPDEASGFVSNRRQQVVVKTPEYASKEQVEYIRDYFQQMEDAVYSSDGYNAEGVYYTEYIDITSAAMMYIIEELTMENDANATSFYCYKDTNDVLHFGPVWDFDWSIGGYNKKELLNTDYLYVQNKTIYNNKTQKCLLAALCSHEDFMQEVAKVWKDTFYPLLQVSIGEAAPYTDNVCSIEEYASLIESSANMNFSRFKFLGTTYWGSAYTGSTFEANVNYVDSFIKKRVAFLDYYFTSVAKESQFYFDNSAARWPEVYAYVWGDYGNKVVPATLIDTEKQIYKVSVTGPYTKVIFKNTDGTNSWKTQTNDLVIPATDENCYKPNGTANKCYGSWYAYIEGEVTPIPTQIPSDNTVTLYYNSGWTNAYAHYKIDGTWTSVPGKRMQATTEYTGYTYRYVIDLGNADTAVVCFNNGNGSWDSKNGANYTVKAGWYGVSNGVVQELKPLVIAPTVTPTTEPTVTPTTEPTAAPTATPIPENQVTVYYNNSNWNKAYIHYNVNGVWTSVPGVPMEVEDEVDGYGWKYVLDLGTKTSATVCFNNGSGSWDSNGSSNYVVGSGDYGIKNGVVTKLNLTYHATLTANKTTALVDKEVTFTATAANGTKPYTFKFDITKDGETVISETTEENTFCWIPSEEGSYCISVTVTDVSGKETKAKVESLKVKNSNTMTIYYKNNNWSNAYIHYKVNGTWTTVPGAKMQISDTSGYTWMYTVDLGETTSAVACFNNGNGSWDSRNGSNYALSGDKVGIMNGSIYVVK